MVAERCQVRQTASPSGLRRLQQCHLVAQAGDAPCGVVAVQHAFGDRLVDSFHRRLQQGRGFRSILSSDRFTQLAHDTTDVRAHDVIACGTSVGVGSIRDGSTVEVRIDGIGALTNTLTPR